MVVRYENVRDYEVQMIVQNGMMNLLSYIERKLNRTGSFTVEILSMKDPAKLSCTYKMGAAEVRFTIEKMCNRDEAFFGYKGREYREDETNAIANVIVDELKRHDKFLEAKREVDEATRRLEEARRHMRQYEREVGC